MNTPAQQELWKAMGFGTLPQYVHMSVTISQTGGKLSKRERPAALRNAIKQIQNIDFNKLAQAGSISIEQLNSFLDGKTTPDMPGIDAMAENLGVQLPEINVVDFFRSGYLPETMVNFLALLGWNPGDGREIMTVSQLVDSFDISRLIKANSLFDRSKLLAFNTEHMRIVPKDKLLGYFREYLKAAVSPVLKADDRTLSRLLDLCAGARTLADVEKKSRFIFIDNDKIEYDEKAVKKVLLDGDGLSILKVVRDGLVCVEPFDERFVEQMLLTLAQKRNVGLGKIAQPLRVALCGSTISISIFEAVCMLGRDNALARIDNTLKKFGTSKKVK